MFMFSDVYVFGVGAQVKKDQLNSLASKKRGEEHVFVLKDYQTLGAVFNSIISKYNSRWWCQTSPGPSCLSKRTRFFF